MPASASTAWEAAVNWPGRDPVTELTQLTLDALVAPRRVVPGQPLDERGGLLGNGGRPCGSGRSTSSRPDGGASAGPYLGDQPVVLHGLRQQPDQRGQDR